MTPLDAFAGVIAAVGALAIAIGRALWWGPVDEFWEGAGCGWIVLGALVLALALAAIGMMHLVWVG